jgi:hypothetical protein
MIRSSSLFRSPNGINTTVDSTVEFIPLGCRTESTRRTIGLALLFRLALKLGEFRGGLGHIGVLRIGTRPFELRGAWGIWEDAGRFLGVGWGELGLLLLNILSKNIFRASRVLALRCVIANCGNWANAHTFSSATPQSTATQQAATPLWSVDTKGSNAPTQHRRPEQRNRFSFFLSNFLTRCSLALNQIFSVYLGTGVSSIQCDDAHRPMRRRQRIP